MDFLWQFRVINPETTFLLEIHPDDLFEPHPAAGSKLTSNSVIAKRRVDHRQFGTVLLDGSASRTGARIITAVFDVGVDAQHTTKHETEEETGENARGTCQNREQNHNLFWRRVSCQVHARNNQLRSGLVGREREKRGGRCLRQN